MTPTHESLYIGGAWRAPHSTATTKAVNPATEEIIGVVPEGDHEDATAAVLAARAAFDDGPWPTMPVRERTGLLLDMAAAFRRRRDELFDLDIRETGRAQATVPLFVDTPIDRWIDLMERVVPAFEFAEPMPPLVEAKLGQGVVLREPWGVASIVTGFNAPFMLALTKLGPALASGCTVVLKPSPYTPLSAFLVAEVAHEVGLPAGVLNLITGASDVGELLTTHPAVDLVSFTGSDTVGRLVLAQAAPTLKKVVLELGGKSANIVCDDADLDKVAPDVLRNFTANCGQGCGMLTRTLVHRSLHDELVTRLLAALPGVRIGDPADPSTQLGPLISAGQRDRVERLIAAGREEGAEVAFGGGRPTHLPTGFYLEPTLLTNVKNSMQVAQQEFFGPVGVVIPFDDDDEAVRLANESNFGLGGGVWSKDPVRAYRIAQRIRTGSVAVNGGSGRLNPHGPFGGYKSSGLGREWGRWGLEEFLQHKTVHWSVATG